MAKPPSDKYVKKVEARQKAFQEGKKGKGGKPLSKAAETKAEKLGEGRPQTKPRMPAIGSASKRIDVSADIAKANKKLGMGKGKGAGIVGAVAAVAEAGRSLFEASDIGFSKEASNLSKPVPKSVIDQSLKHKRAVAEGRAKLAGRDQGQPSSRAKPKKMEAPAVEKAPAKRKLSEFESAFASARKGGAKEFEFKGKKYNTKLKGEK